MATAAPVALVGHSFGGGRVLQVANRQAQLVTRAVILDSYLHFADDPPYPWEQPAEPYLRDYIAQHSIRAVEAGRRCACPTLTIT